MDASQRKKVPSATGAEQGGGTPTLDQGDPGADLLARIADGEKQALKQLYNLTSGRLMTIALRMLGNRPMAEEAVQDTFLAVWNSASRFNPNLGTSRAWITTILRRKAIDRLRASPWLLREIELEDLGSAAPDTALQASVRQCLDRLKEDYRVSLLYVYFFGLTHAELSEKLQRPIGTIKSWVRRGLLDLKRCLEP